MKHRPLRAAVALSAALTTALAPMLAHAQTQYEFRRPAKALVVKSSPSNGTDQGAGQGASEGTPALSLSTQAVDFGNVATNTTEKRQVLVSNPGDGTLSITRAATVSGAAEFAAGLTTCGSTLAAGADCLLEPTFSPTTTGTFNGVLTFTTTLASSPHDITLVGTAFNPVSLASATLPVARVGQPYSYDFKPLLAVSNETSPAKSEATWSGSGALPAGLSLDQGTGVLSGTPSSTEPGASYTVTGTYKNNQGQQVFTIVVNGLALQVVQISAGGGHTCAVTVEGGAKCWGLGTSGQLGAGNTNSSLLPVDVVGLTSNIAMVSAGYVHTCAVTTSGAAKCWGGNNRGQLGDGTTLTRTSPVDVSGLSVGVTAISAGGYSGSSNSHTCAITAGGAAVCWGGNSSGRLGDGTTTNRATPVPVIGLSSGVTAISAGGAHTCAIQSGQAKCWGAGGSGRLGYGSTSNQLSPVSVTGLANAVSISAGGSHSCAQTSAGAAVCWGHNDSGQLGDGTKTDRSTPVGVQGLQQGVSSVIAGYYHTCALTSAGAVSCWGLNDKGQLGTGNTTDSSTPLFVIGLSSGVRQISLTRSGLETNTHTCGVLSDGSAQCWGNNQFGQLGNGATANSTTPIDVKPQSGQ